MTMEIQGQAQKCVGLKPIEWDPNPPLLIDFWFLTPLSAIFQLYHGDQF
jgi:hypothetical protein